MIALVYGALGAAAVLLLLTLGAVLGWRCAMYRRAGLEENIGEEMHRRLAAEQRAFEAMLHYNSDAAYGQYEEYGEMEGDAL